MTNYLAELAAALAQAQPGAMTMITIAHDDDCGHCRGLPRDCYPGVTSEPAAATGGSNG